MERILLVSATEKSRTMLSQFLTSCGVQAQLAPASSGAEARRMLVDGLFDLILVNTPLPDEFGHDMAQQAANDTLSGVILLAKAEIADSVAEKVEDDGVFVVPKPLSRVLFMQALRMTRAARSRLTGLQSENRRLQKRLHQSLTLLWGKNNRQCAVRQRHSLKQFLPLPYPQGLLPPYRQD